MLCCLPSGPERGLRCCTDHHSSSWLAWKCLASLRPTLITSFLTPKQLQDGWGEHPAAPATQQELLAM